MIIAKIKGGLGNQMFQYACARALALKYQVPLKLDASYYIKKDAVNLLNDTTRRFSLDNFNINVELASAEEINKVNPLSARLAKKIKNRLTELFVGRFNGYEDKYPAMINPAKDIFLDGNWQKEKYFKDIENIIREEFTLKNSLNQKSIETSKLIEDLAIAGKTSISIHIRRTDYVTVKINKDFFHSCDLAYYQTALDKITEKINNKKNIDLFVFSDDIGWAKENLKFPAFNDAPLSIHFVSDPQIPDYEEMHLMSLCRHNIIANSTFSWWGTWLNQNNDKIIVAPKQWFANKTSDELDILPKKWLQVTNTCPIVNSAIDKRKEKD